MHSACGWVLRRASDLATQAVMRPQAPPGHAPRVELPVPLVSWTGAFVGDVLGWRLSARGGLLRGPGPAGFRPALI